MVNVPVAVPFIGYFLFNLLAGGCGGDTDSILFLENLAANVSPMRLDAFMAAANKRFTMMYAPIPSTAPVSKSSVVTCIIASFWSYRICVLFFPPPGGRAFWKAAPVSFMPAFRAASMNRPD
jgi:hypothetical protein